MLSYLIRCPSFDKTSPRTISAAEHTKILVREHEVKIEVALIKGRSAIFLKNFVRACLNHVECTAVAAKLAPRCEKVLPGVKNCGKGIKRVQGKGVLKGASLSHYFYVG